MFQICFKGMTAGDALKLIKTKRDVWPNKENLAHLVRISNDVHGFDAENDENDDNDDKSTAAKI